MIRKLAAATALAVVLVGSAQAQSKNMSAQEQANLKLVLNWWHDVLMAGHVELAPKYMAEDYIQHNPNVSTGRAAFMQFFGSFAKPKPLESVPMPAPVYQFAKGDYVVLVWDHDEKDPMDPSKTYKYNTFDLIRIQNGHAQEHWDSATKMAPPPGAPAQAVIPGVGPAPVAPKNTPQEEKNQAIALVEFKDILQYGHVELAPKVMAEGYIQHNPNVPNGREGFMKFFSQIRKPEPIKAEWKNKPELVVTSGNLVVVMSERTDKDPADPSKTYKWNWFDMVRVDDGMVQEHWDQAKKNPPPAAKPAA